MSHGTYALPPSEDWSKADEPARERFGFCGGANSSQDGSVSPSTAAASDAAALHRATEVLRHAASQSAAAPRAQPAAGGH